MNSRLDTIQAGILIEKLKLFPNEITLRQKKADFYNEHLSKIYIKPFVEDSVQSVWAQYTVRVKSYELRCKVLKTMEKLKIPIMIYYPIPLHRQKAYIKYFDSDISLSVSERVSNTVFSLPMSPYLTENEQINIIKNLNTIVK